MAIAQAVLLFLGVAIELLCVVGVVAMDNVFDRLHFLGPSSVGLLATVIAVALQEGPSTLGVKAAFMWPLALLAGSVFAHAAARAARVRQLDTWAVLPSERDEAHQ